MSHSPVVTNPTARPSDRRRGTDPGGGLAGAGAPARRLGRRAILADSLIRRLDPARLTGALDSRTGREVMLFLQKLNAEGNTIILITHDNSIAAKAKRIIRITDGRIVYDGPAEGDVTVMNQHGAGEDAPEDERAKGAT